MTWAAVPGNVQHYHVRTDFGAPGSFPFCSAEVSGTQYTTQVPTEHLLQFYNKVMACTAPPNDLCSPMSVDFTMAEAVDNSSWDYAFTYYRLIGDIRFQFLNVNPGGLRLQLHIRSGSAPTSPEVAITPCIPGNSISAVQTYLASSFAVVGGSDVLGTQGHDVLSTTACDISHNDNSTIGWGVIPGAGLPPPPAVGGLADRPEVAGAPVQAGGSSGANGGLLAAVAAAVMAGTIVLGGVAWRVRKSAGRQSRR